MPNIRDIRRIAWDHEFDIVDDQSERQLGRLERLRRVQASRALGMHGVPAPTPGTGASSRLAPAQTQINMTRHGQARLQQRGISVDQVMAVLDFGKEQRSHGASRYFLDKQTRQRLAVEMPSALRALPTLDIQVVISDSGALITAAHRTKRIRRDTRSTYTASSLH